MNFEQTIMKIPSELINNYLQRRINELDSLENAINNGDFAHIFKIGHQLKGNGLTFGFGQISEIGSKLESSALVQNKHDIELHLKEYRAVLHAILNHQH
jgi:HPt (histidine-containing phosphotransfer) domain-containing protein